MKATIGKSFVDNNGKIVTLSTITEAKVVLMFFSANWCPPCKAFFPIMKRFYEEVNEGRKYPRLNLEIIYVPCEDGEEEFLDTLKNIIFPCIPFGDPRIDKLQEQFEVDVIPCLLLMKKDGTVDKPPLRHLIQSKGASCFQELCEMTGQYFAQIISQVADDIIYCKLSESG
eukprot:TRINITY_DN1067_c0_g1_i1.p2 TRINITY_DN1067_c0_g1~~TRINITY_DN1067_c0_g1_i1.p2  ORF type:complete len:171 (+),score=20.75 TRINITY_DN1067_c0_g1_i1:63-575(+)